MDIVKKNLVSIICGAVALLAVVALFYPVSGYYAELQRKADERKSAFSTLSGLRDKSRNLPVVSLGNSDAQKLEVFPNDEVIKAANAVVEKVKSESAAMFETAIKMNVHRPLVDGALPEGRPTAAGAFRRAYNRQMLVDMFSILTASTAAPSPTGPDPHAVETAANGSDIWRVMKAGFPPTEQQITIARNKRIQEIKDKTAYNGQNQPINGPQIEAELKTEVPKVADELKNAAAKNCLVYIDTTSLDPVSAILNLPAGTAPDPTNIFSAQVGLWVQQDVALAIADANQGSRTVIESPVKRLIQIRLRTELFQGATASGGSATPSASADPSGTIPHDFMVSPTGRVSNGVYDVVPFTLRLDVDAQQVPHVLQALSRNRFITVNNCSLSTVDNVLMQAMGYLYGDKPVVQLDLQCEELLFRKWTQPLMPLRVQQSLGITQPATGGQQ